jgi:hypothetical protein
MIDALQEIAADPYRLFTVSFELGLIWRLLFHW